jgi:hypothetical protein
MRIKVSTKVLLLAVCGLMAIASLLIFLNSRAKARPAAVTQRSQKRPASPRKAAVEKQDTVQTTAAYLAPVRLADVKHSEINEGSGIVASRANPGVYWAHNDSGDGPFIYAFDATGARRGTWRVAGARARDWESSSLGPGAQPSRSYLYIGDIGDNSRRRTEIVVYRIPEPVVTTAERQTSKKNPATTEPAETITLRYPDGSHDAEALLIHPLSGNLYIITKETFENPGIYEAPAPLDSSATITLRLVGKLKVPGIFGGMITDGSISPDGKHVALCDYLQGYELTLAASDADFNAIWTQPLRTIALGSRPQGEAITYRLDGQALLATSEGSPMPLIEVRRK